MNILLSHPSRLLPHGLSPALLALAMLLGGCGGNVPMPKIDLPKPPPPTRLVMEVNASRQLNINTDGTAAPLLVRIYELRDGGQFMGSGFFPLYENDRGTLGADLVGRDEIFFKPGETRVIEKTLSPTTTTIGVMGAYRSTDERRWRATAPILPEKVNRFRLDLGSRELALSPQP